ncbi:MAG: translocation/assembly module TamB domain-containing protein [Leptolyngbyaceae cyanobacterium]
MTQIPPPDREPNSEPVSPTRRRQWRRVVAPVGLGLLAGTGAVAWWGWNFVKEQLPPIVAKNLSETLNRPVKVGKVEGLGLNGIRLGPSSIPPTANDTDRATVEAVEASFNPLQTLLTRKLALDVTLIKPDIFLEQQKDGWITTRLKQQEEEGFIELKTMRAREGTVELLALGKTAGKRSPVILNQVNGKVDFLDKNKRFVYELAARSATGGDLDLKGESRLPSQDTKLQVRANNLLLAEVGHLLNLPFDFPKGRGGGNLTVELSPNVKFPPIYGTAQFTDTTMVISQVPQPFTKATGKLQFRGETLQLDNVNAFYGKAQGVANGTIELGKSINLAVKVKPTSLPDLAKTLKLTLPVPVSGEVTADLKVTGPQEKPILSGVARSTKPGRIDRIDVSQYSTAFKLDTGAEEILIQEVQVTPTAGGRVTGGGRIDLGNKNAAGKLDPKLAFNFLVASVPGDPIAAGYNNGNPPPVKIGPVSAIAQVSGTASAPQTFVRWQAPDATYAGSGEISIANGIITLKNTSFNVAGGTAKVEGVAVNGLWRGVLTASGIPLSRFSPDLKGLFSGQFTASGSLSSFSPANIQAQGTARFSEGISLLQGPLVAQARWNGEKLLLQQATAPGFSADGTIALNVAGTPSVTGIDLNVRLSDFNLQAVAGRLPGNVRASGRADFAGRVTGTPVAPRVDGNLALKNFVLNDVAFDPYLQGRVQYGPGVRLDLRGERDRIAAVLDSQFRPIAFDIRRADAFAQGRTQNGLLLTQIGNFPLELLQGFGFPPQYAPSGQLSGNLAINWDRRTANGDITVLQPGLGYYRANQFSGQISFANGVVTLTNGQLQRGNTLLQIAATANLTGGLEAKSQINVVRGEVQDVLETLQFFDLQDFQRGLQPPNYGTIADLKTVPIDMIGVPIQDQLRRITEIEKLLAQIQKEREDAPIPPLRELNGQFTGTINTTISSKTGIKTDFNLQGEDFEWGRFSAKQVVVIGTFDNTNGLTFLPLRLQSDDAVIAFSGQVLGKQQSGQLRVENFPVDQLKAVVALPFKVEGLLNATATLSGSFDNPQVVGSLNLVNGVLNDTPVQSARGNFTYANARLDFTSTLAMVEPEPLYLVGSIPLKLPFASVSPVSDAIRLDINVKNEGLALLNVFTDQVSWVDGQGEVGVQVRGTLTNPIANGIARVDNATLKAKALPDPLTNVTGSAQFDADRIRVERLQGAFSDGKIAAAGVIPLANPLATTDPDVQNPLSVALEQIRLNLKGVYQGGVNGNVTVTGTALNPVLGGKVVLSQGQIFLPDQTQTAAAPGTGGQQNAAIELAGLQLELGRGVTITQPPLLRFAATGNLEINGSLSDLQPQGTIRLLSGQINLFTTQFTLERGYPQTATFTPAYKLDPELNVRMIALVSEVINRRQPTVLSSSEILDIPTPATSLGSLQTVRVRAEVRGLASRLSENLKLSSSPPRSEEEIVALIGGSFIDTLGRDPLSGVASLAGSALLNNVQTFIGRALGLSEFRLFPTYSSENKNSQGGTATTTSTLGLAAEAAIDITPALSVTLLKVLTNNQPAQIGLRYRINDNLLLRGSTDFSGDSRATLEYEARF